MNKLTIDELKLQFNKLGYKWLPFQIVGIRSKNDQPNKFDDLIGLIENDIILEVNGKKIDDKNGMGLTNLISQYSTGDKIMLKIWHKGQEKNIEITLEERK